MASALKILVVDDEAELRALLEKSFAREGHEVVSVADGVQALEHADADGFDIVLLDVALGPGPSGYDVARELRARRNVVPIIMLTALDSEADAVQGLEAGADDYVTKPFGLAELRSRIRAVLRRVGGRVLDDGNVVTIGPVELDRRRRAVTCRGEPVRLTFSEFELLSCLASSPGRLYNRQELLRAIWGDSAYRDPRAIDVHIRHLREKLEESPEQPELILTVRGAGYRFQTPVSVVMRYGLRPRLLASLLLTAAVTLGAAAIALLGPLQDRLREDASNNLRAAVLASRPEIEREMRPGSDELFLESAFALGERTDSRVQVYNRTPAIRYDSATRGGAVPPEVYSLLARDRTVVRTTPDEALVVVELNGRRAGGVLVARKPLTDVAATVDQVRDAFLTAALIGLAVALLLGTGISSTLLRRLERLREAAVANTPVPADDSRDEVGDLTRALASMQASINRQESARRAFVATASHELRTPLTLLRMLELLDDDLREGRVDLDDAQVQIAGAQRQLRRLEHLASDLLDLSRLDSEAPLRSEPIELGELTRAVAAEFELRAGERGLSVDVVPPIGPCWASGDPGAVARIVRILLDNALRFAPPGEAVHVGAAYHGETATIAVTNSGPGVPAEERDLIFERFRRGSSTGGEEGFGLGLAIGRELAERLGGHLDLASDAGEPGARFVLSLPIELPAGSHPREPEHVA